MIKKTLFAIFALFASLFAGAQTYTFECVASGRLTGDSCDICPSTTVESRSFNGLVIFRDGEFYRWVDQPYSIREKPGGMIEYWEHAVTPYNERVSIPFALTGFFSIQGMKDSTWCNSPGPVRFQELQLDSVSPTLAKIRLSGSNTGVGVRAGTALSFDFQSDTLKIDASGVGTVTDFSAGDLSPLFTTSEATTTTTPALSFAPIAQSANTFYGGQSSGGAANPTFRLLTTGDITGLLVANNGVSDNEAGGVYRLGNRYMNSPDAPFTTDRKVNVADNTLFFGDNSDSTLLGIFGLDGRVGIRTAAASRALHVNGEVRITDLVTDAPTLIVGADADGDLAEITVGSGLSLAAGVLTSTVTGYTDEQAQDAVGTILTDGSIIDFTYNDATPSITATVINNSIGNAQIRQGVARSVVGVTGNATANVADIQSSGANLPLVTNAANTAISWAQLQTGGLADDAVTYAKIQNVVNDERLLGRVSGANGVVEELTQAQVQTFLGITGTANRFALWTGTNTLASDAAFTFNGTTDRATFTGSTTGTGANSGILNLNTGSLGAATTFLRMSGNVSSNMIAEITNANNATTNANSIINITTGGAAAGDPILQFQVSGAMTTSMGIDNTDGDRFKITPNSATPGGIANHGLIVWDNAGTAMTGVNKDFPGQVLDIGGRARSEQFIGPASNQLNAGNIAFGTGAGTGPTLVSITGNSNMAKVSFTTGTSPTAGGDIITITYAPQAFPVTSFPMFCAGDTDSASEITKFYISTSNAGNFTLKSNGALTASTTYILFFSYWGY